MKTIWVAACSSCGEDIFLDEAPTRLASLYHCVSCGSPTIAEKFKEEEIADVTKETP